MCVKSCVVNVCVYVCMFVCMLACVQDVIRLCVDVWHVLSDFNFSYGHLRIGRTSDACQNSAICVDSC